MFTDGIRKLAVSRLADQVNTVETLERFLRRWWCLHYKRPFKDPLLDEYTLEELLLEFYEVYYAENPKELSKVKGEPDPEEQEKQEDEDWLEQQVKQTAPIPEDLQPEEGMFDFRNFKGL